MVHDGERMEDRALLLTDIFLFRCHSVVYRENAPQTSFLGNNAEQRAEECSIFAPDFDAQRNQQTIFDIFSDDTRNILFVPAFAEWGSSRRLVRKEYRTHVPRKPWIYRLCNSYNICNTRI